MVRPTNCSLSDDRRIQALNRANWLRENLRNPTPNIVPGVPVSDSKGYPQPADPATHGATAHEVTTPRPTATPRPVKTAQTAAMRRATCTWLMPRRSKRCDVWSVPPR